MLAVAMMAGALAIASSASSSLGSTPNDGFDLSDPETDDTDRRTQARSRWSLPEIDEPVVHRERPRFRWQGRKVKLRIPLPPI